MRPSNKQKRKAGREANDSADNEKKSKSKKKVTLIKGQGKKPDLITEFSEDNLIKNDDLHKLWVSKDSHLNTIKNLLEKYEDFGNPVSLTNEESNSKIVHRPT